MYADVLKSIGSKPWVPKVLCGILGLFILLVILLGLRDYFSWGSSRIEATSPVVKFTEPVPLDRASIVKMTFFGDYIPDNLADADVKESGLNMTVEGIIYSIIEKESFVILKLSESEHHFYHVGDTIPGGAVIKRIQPDEIFVMRHGVIESLSLPEKELIFDPPPQPLL